MPWPSDQDYNEAVQNPKSAFQDADLQSGQIELNPLGIPRPRAGNFATVYKVFVNGVPYAAKCFKRDEPEYGRRYPAIATHLSNTRLPYFVPFRYMSHGIRVGGKLYPLLKMKWAEGESLISYVEKNLNSPAVLQSLATSWIRLLTDLQKASIAHGDLQHGNVLVIGGQLRLVDYDGMYVPALEGSRGLEDGHSNYQHPGRTGLDFGAYLDNFSAWLIYVSLLALSVRPRLWQDLKSGDEFLLFRKQDLVAPDRSEAFRLLRSIPDENTRDLVERLEDFLWTSPSRIPPITDDLLTLLPPPSAPTSPKLAGWIKDHVDLSPSHVPKAPAIDAEEAEIGDPSWIQDHVHVSSPIGSFQNSVWIDRVVALLALAVMSMIWVWTWVNAGISNPILTRLAAGLTATGSALLAWFVRYRLEPVAIAARPIGIKLRDADRSLRIERAAHDKLKTKRQQLRDTLSADLLRVQTKKNSIQAEEVKETAHIETKLKDTLRHLQDKRRALASDEATQKRQLSEKVSKLSLKISSVAGQEQHELGLIDSGLGAKIRGLEAQLQRVKLRQDSELRQALKDYQDQIVMSHLHKFRISDADIPGVGEELKRRLAQSGYASAADVATRRVAVSGIGTKKWTSLRTWVMSLDNTIRPREAPHFLPSHKTADIERRHEASIKQLQQDLTTDRTRFSTEVASVRGNFSEQRRLLEVELKTEEANAHQQTKLVEAKFESQRKTLDNEDSQARAQAGKATEECVDRFSKLSAEATEHADRLRDNYSKELEAISKELGELAKRVREAAWRRDGLSRARAAYSEFTFSRYCSRMLNGRSS